MTLQKLTMYNGNSVSCFFFLIAFVISLLLTFSGFWSSETEEFRCKQVDVNGWNYRILLVRVQYKIRVQKTVKK